MLKMLKSIIRWVLKKMGYQLSQIKYCQVIRRDVEIPYKDAIPLKREHIQNCKLVTSREELLNYMPKKSICAEVGVMKGDFSAKILSAIDPVQLHLIDIVASKMDKVKERFSEKIGTQVFLHYGDSFAELMKFQNGFFDWIYIDANHTYDYVAKDLEMSRLKVKDKGLIVLNDYIFYDHCLHSKYGVVEAVNEFCNKHNYEILFFALEVQMFNDVVLSKIR